MYFNGSRDTHAYFYLEKSYNITNYWEKDIIFFCFVHMVYLLYTASPQILASISIDILMMDL